MLTKRNGIVSSPESAKEYHARLWKTMQDYVAPPMLREAASDRYEISVLGYQKYDKKQPASVAEHFSHVRDRAASENIVGEPVPLVDALQLELNVLLAAVNSANAKLQGPTVAAAAQGGPGPISGGIAMGRREDYRIDRSICPGCGGASDVYACDACWQVCCTKIPAFKVTSTGLYSDSRDWIYNYFTIFNGGREAPKAPTPVIKYPDMCPCQIKSVMCDYHRGL